MFYKKLAGYVGVKLKRVSVYIMCQQVDIFV